MAILDFITLLPGKEKSSRWVLLVYMPPQIFNMFSFAELNQGLLEDFGCLYT